jgi:hypothetical protein
MLWRSMVTLITGFWLVMTVLLVRVTYFPEGSQFARLPPAAVLKTFLERGAAGKQLHLYHGDDKIGHVTIDIRPMPGAREADDFALLISGMLDRGAVPAVNGSVNWRLSLNLRAGQRWAGAGGQVRLPESGVLLDFTWVEGRSSPEFTLHRRGELQADDRMLQAMLGQVTSNSGPGASTGAAADDFLKVTAREGVMKIPGQRLKGSVVGFSVLERYRATAYFTEEGDLALIELPEGYRALEPNIHGLVPDELDEPEPGP